MLSAKPKIHMCPKHSNQGYYSPHIQTCLWWPKKDCIESLTVPTMARNIWMSRNVQIRCLDVATVAKNVWMHPCWPKMIKSDLYVLVLDKNDWIECWNVPMMHLWLPDLFKSDVQFDVQINKKYWDECLNVPTMAKNVQLRCSSMPLRAQND